ncbi:MAG TPA: DUF3772 domain-containing protein [Hyphomicrobium sp.]|nr:DUF3772 domain-containing protein [Hyphomicrobium sp.]
MARDRFFLRYDLAVLAFALLVLAFGANGAGAQTLPSPLQLPGVPAAPAEMPPKEATPAPQQQPAAETPAVPAEPAPAPVLTAAELQSLDELRQPVMELKGLLETLEGSIERNKENDAELARLRAELVDLVQNAQDRLTTLKSKTDTLRQLFEKLKPAPDADAAPETEQVTAERARLATMLGEIDGARKTGELVQVRARQLQTDVQKLRQELFTQQILNRSPSPLKTSTWDKLVYDSPGAWRQIVDAASGWLQAASEQWFAVSALILGTLFFYIAVATLVRRFVSYQLDAARVAPPRFVEQAATVGWVAPLLALAGLGTIGVLAAGLDTLGLLTLDVGSIAQRAFVVLAVFVAVRALTQAVLQPQRPDWRLVDIATPAARRLARIVSGIAFVFSMDLILQEVIRRLYLPLSVNAMETVLASVAIALLLLKLVNTPFDLKTDDGDGPVAATAEGQPPAQGLQAGVGTAAEPAAPEVPASPLRPYLIKLPALAGAVALLLASLLGYVGLARLIATHVVVTGGAIAVVLVIHLAIRSLLAGPVKSMLEDGFGLDAHQAVALRRVASVVLNAALALVAIPLVLVTWGYTTQEALSWLRAAVFGFEIGEVRISLARILFAIALFLALVFATRLAQKWLDTGVLRSQRIDQGIANSIRTAVGYVGFILAVLVAVSYGGLDITNFAIVAGALSVGIGFGLQSIVNNFVSGLILLVERPIKVGDRVTVNNQDGFVRRISVRSTEIETFDRASLIVPNSELITGTVTNWTHRNSLGRALVNVSVSYQSDPEQVRDILLKVASECPLILQHPPPWVGLDNFGPNGLDFLLIAVVGDVTAVGGARSDLRFRILKAFREEGIEIALAQHDVHLRDLDVVRGALARLAEDRARERGSVEPDPKPAG